MSIHFKGKPAVVAPVATGSIMGFGGYGYELAVHALADSLK